MIIDEFVKIELNGTDNGTLRVYRGCKMIYMASNINCKRATHWNYCSDYEYESIILPLLDAITECTNYHKCAAEKHDKYGKE